MSDDSRTDVIIIGAGPVGLTLANELARRGVAVRVLEKTGAIREVSKAMILHVRTQEALGKVGIMERVRAEAQPLTEVVVHAYGKHIGSWDLAGIDSGFPNPLMIGQNRTQHLLLDALSARGVAVEWNSEATALSVGEDEVQVTIRRGETEERARARYVVGCEGSSSLVRKTVGLSFEGERYSGEQFIQADCKIRWTLPRGRSYLFLTEVGYMMVIEMPGDTVRVFISLPDQPTSGQGDAAHSQGAAEDIRNEPTLEEVRDNLVRLCGIPAELSEGTWLARYRTSHRYANAFRQGRAFVAGDAGHVHVPIGGQGMNTGIQDAFNLGWKLAGVISGLYEPTLLDSYNAERHPVARDLIRGTDMAYRGVLHPSELQQHAARRFGPYLLRLGPVQQFMRNTLEELSIHYPATPLSCDCGGGGPRPGDRVPDATVVRWEDKRTLTVYDLMREAEWVLLILGGSREADVKDFAARAAMVAARHGKGQAIQAYLVIPAAVPPSDLGYTGPMLMDATRILHEKYGATQPALYLLRPDTFVAFRGTARDTAALDKHLAGLFHS